MYVFTVSLNRQFMTWVVASTPANVFPKSATVNGLSSCCIKGRQLSPIQHSVFSLTPLSTCHVLYPVHPRGWLVVPLSTHLVLCPILHCDWLARYLDVYSFNVLTCHHCVWPFLFPVHLKGRTITQLFTLPWVAYVYKLNSFIVVSWSCSKHCKLT